jgi:tetratricopeptide (TPR) repeat protein
MGKVYRAVGPDGPVALKIVHPHLLETPGFFKRFLREAEVGKKVRHANVVRTIDVDAISLEGRQHNYLVMEYVEGKSLRDLLHDLGTIPETLLREIALQTAAGLGAIHAAGIVHRDLKPENVLITDDHEVRIMDLGVAKLQEATIAITREGQFAGSVLYAAPEQFRGDVDVGPWADLYSLGVMLHELCTGDNPFRRDDAAGVIDAHLKLDPPRVTHLNSEVSAYFSECVATLLSKTPGDRFESADSLRSILEQGEKSAWWTELAPKLRKKVEHLPKIRVRRETKLHGRAGDLRLLSEAWERAKNADGSTVLVEGEAGIGKTRLVDAFLQGLADRDIHVLYGSYPPSGGLGGISQAVLGKFGEAGLAEALAPYLTVTPSLVPAFAAVLKHESPPTGSEPLGGEALQAVCVHLMRALAEERPLIWILDDLHFAPRESRDVVLALARAVEGHRVLVVATARPGVPDDELANFSRLENFQRVKLARLGGREIIELLEDAFKSEALAEKLGVKITKKSDGVPFFIFEMIRGLKEGQFIRQEPDGSYVQTQVIEEIEVPSAVKDLIEGRMRGLTESQRAILDAGAVQGLVFDPDLVATVVEERPIRVLRELAEIERRSGLVRGEGELVRFDQNQIQEVLYGELLPRLRREYHTLLANAYAEECGEEPKGDDAVFLVHHHLRGSRPNEALLHLEPAFGHLERSYRNDAVLDLARRALEAAGLLEGKERVEVLLRQAGRLNLLGRRDEERAALDCALALADETGDDVLRAKARQSLGSHLTQVPEYTSAQECLERALELARDAEDKKIEAGARGGLGNVLWMQGRQEEAREQYEMALALAREIGDRVLEAGLTGSLGVGLFHQGFYEQARSRIDTHLAIAREMGDVRQQVTATGNLGVLTWALGHFEEARQHYESALALAREIGDRVQEAWATGNVGGLNLTRGHLKEAGEYSRRHLALAREVGERRLEAWAANNLGGFCLALGRLGKARESIERSLELAREVENKRLEARNLLRLAAVAEAEDDPDGAKELYEEAVTLARDVGDQTILTSAVLGVGWVEALQGKGESAVAHLDEALKLGRQMKSPETVLLATVARARTPGGDIDAAVRALEEHEERAGHRTKMKARFGLWELTKDKTHLTEAKRLLTFMRDHAPEDCRTSMIENIPLHRDIMRAWEEHGVAGG